jgi:uridine phosphorylase
MGSPLQPSVVVMFALRREAAAFRPWARSRNRLMTRVTGVGRERAERAIREVLREGAPALVITAGFAGALRPGLAVGTVCYDADAGHALAPLLQAAGAQPARFYCAGRMLITARQKAECHRETGADAVEMESGWIREQCRQAGVASATVRVISDTAEEDLPLDFNRLTDASQRLCPFKLAAALLRRPAAVPALWRLRRQTAIAGRALAAVLQRALDDWFATTP